MEKSSVRKSRVRENGGRARVTDLSESIRLAKMLQEKCELRESHDVWMRTLPRARAAKDTASQIECLLGLLRLAGEALDPKALSEWERELDRLVIGYRRKNARSGNAVSGNAVSGNALSGMVWYCKGVVAMRFDDYRQAQLFYHRAIRSYRQDRVSAEERAEGNARGWLGIANCLLGRGYLKRARFLAEALEKDPHAFGARGVRGSVHYLLGNIAERKREFDQAERSYREAHASFLVEHNWYHHLYVLLGYARLARLRRSYAQAYWYLDLLEKAAPGAEFGAIRREIATEKRRLEADAVDLLIDSRNGRVRTRESEAIELGKQYVLLHILEALLQAHGLEGADAPGLSKAEIIEKVWGERYRPEAHDNKLYYNINRLRKLIEPDMRKPQYLLNWREGYRLAPGLRVQWVKDRVGEKARFQDS